MLFFLLCFASLFGEYQARIDLPPRLQWVENGGYCGEMSFIAAGLYYGQYASQYDVRALLGDQKKELLIGYNDEEAARKMHLSFISWDHRQEKKSAEFLQWVKKQVCRGYPVAIGLYMNEYLFYGNPDPLAGFTDYDHIVSVDGIASKHPLTENSYSGGDQISFSDHGLWDEGIPRYNFSYFFAPFQGDRREANRVDGEIYTLPNEGKNYGIALTGVADLNHETLPVRVETSLNYEEPSIEEGSNQRPEPMPLLLTVTVSGLKPNQPYLLYRYNSFEAVPDSNFHNHSEKAVQVDRFQISFGSTFTVQHNILSNEIAIYRCVAESS